LFFRIPELKSYRVVDGWVTEATQFHKISGH